MYWEIKTGIRRPFQSTVCVPGKTVVSVRKGLPSTCPSKTAERPWLIGKSGFVITVECEKDGTARSTRLFAGAQPFPLYVPQTVDVFPKGMELDLPLLSQPLSASAAAIPSPGSSNLRMTRRP
jgi:hypothetical protein